MLKAFLGSLTKLYKRGMTKEMYLRVVDRALPDNEVYAFKSVSAAGGLLYTRNSNPKQFASVYPSSFGKEETVLDQLKDAFLKVNFSLEDALDIMPNLKAWLEENNFAKDIDLNKDTTLRICRDYFESEDPASVGLSRVGYNGKREGEKKVKAPKPAVTGRKRGRQKKNPLGDDPLEIGGISVKRQESIPLQPEDKKMLQDQGISLVQDKCDVLDSDVEEESVSEAQTPLKRAKATERKIEDEFDPLEMLRAYLSLDANNAFKRAMEKAKSDSKNPDEFKEFFCPSENNCDMFKDEESGKYYYRPTAMAVSGLLPHVSYDKKVEELLEDLDAYFFRGKIDGFIRDGMTQFFQERVSVE